MMQKFRSTRRSTSPGAALVETALILIFCLGLVLGTYQIAYLSYMQINLDSAAQITARVDALTYGYNTWKPWLQQNLPGMSGIDIEPYELFNPNQVTTDSLSLAGANGGTVGGFSFSVPFPAGASATSNTAAGSNGGTAGTVYIGNQAIHLVGVGFEAAVEEICPHVCANGTQQGQKNSVLPFSAQSENTGPYFMSFNFMRACYADATTDFTLPYPGLNGAGNTTNYEWDTCHNLTQGNINNSTVDLRAVGTAAHLDASIQGYLNPTGNMLYLKPPSISGESTLGSTAPSIQNAGPFFQVWCHRDIFVWLEVNVFNKSWAQVQQMTPGPFYSLWFNNNPTTNSATPLPGNILYNSSPTHTAAGWDVDPFGGGTPYVVQLYGTPGQYQQFYGCGIY